MKDFQTKMTGSISGQSGGEILKLFPPFFFLFNLSSYLSLSRHVYILWMFRCTYVLNERLECPFSPSLPVTLWQMKRWSELSRPMKLYFCFSVVSLLVLVCVTSHSVNKQHRSTDINHEDNFTVSLIQLFGLRECQWTSGCSGRPPLSPCCP